jgi:N-acetylglutamate synthase-like GNAT family acetyltransferase
MALKESKDYYTAAQVKAILGITDGMLYNYVDNGALERIIPPGKKQGVYHRNQVEQLARDLQVFITTRNEQSTIFSKATKEDIPACIEIGASTYPGIQQGITSLEARLAWLEKNPDLYYVVRHNGEIVGYTAIIPMKPDKIHMILENKAFMRDIKPEEIEAFKPGIPLHIYISTMRTKRTISKTEKRAYGVRLIGGLITTFIEMIEKGITIDTLYARSETVDGIRALKHMGFVQISSTQTSPTTIYRNFALNMGDSGTKILQGYKQALTKRNMPEEEFKVLVFS